MNNDLILPFRDSLEHESKISQKPYRNDLCHVAILKELVDGTLEIDFTNAFFRS